MILFFPEKFIEKTLQLFVPNSKRLGGYNQWVHSILQKCTPLRSFYKNISGCLFGNYPDQPCFYPEEPEGTRRFSSSTMNCSGACWYRTYRVLYQVDFYLEAYPRPMVKIEGHGPRCTWTSSCTDQPSWNIRKVRFCNRFRTLRLYPARTRIAPHPSLPI
jgi:hypothetical protein